MTKIDLNADIGEYQTVAQQAAEETLIPLVTSVNIACGGHAGNNETMAWTLKKAIESKVSIGAHPSYPDRENFGRQSINISHADLAASLRTQIQTLQNQAEAFSTTLSHIKPHGALYNDAAQNEPLGDLLLALADEFQLPLICLAGSKLHVKAFAQNRPFVAEGFIDRGYQENGQLIPRGQKGALLLSIEERCAQALALVENGIGLEKTPLETLCIHSDSYGASQTALAVSQALRANGIEIMSVNQDE